MNGSHKSAKNPKIKPQHHYYDIIMGAIASQITSFTIVYSTVYSDADQSKHQSSASLAFVCEIHRGPVNNPHKWPVTRKMFPFDDVINTPNHSTILCIFHGIYSSKWTLERFIINASVSDGHGDRSPLNSSLDNMDAISQTIFSYVFSCMKSFVFCLKFHWSFSLRVQLTITQHWFR